MLSRWIISLAVAAIVALGGCSGEPQVAPAARLIAEGKGSASNPGQEYLIGPGDTLRVFVLRSPELSTEVPVRPDGKISTPLVNDMSAVGKTPSQLANDLAAVLSEFVRSPTVSVIVTQPHSVFSQVQVVGQATTPRSVPYRSGMRVLDIMIEVGGLGTFAAGNRAKIVRSKDGKIQELRVRIEDLINKGDMSQNIELSPGDVLVIPEARF